MLFTKKFVCLHSAVCVSASDFIINICVSPLADLGVELSIGMSQSQGILREIRTNYLSGEILDSTVSILLLNNISRIATNKTF